MNSLFPFKKPQSKRKSNLFSSQWNILIVDDEPSIHEVTALVLEGKRIENKKLNLVSAYDAKQAKEILTNSGLSFAAAFIDVVMEEEHSGLELVKWIRTELNNKSIRLVLRTGQAGVAPEETVIRDYDINDYKTKTELTASKLVTTTYNAIRGYRDISIIERSLVGFQELIEASNDMLQLRKLKDFGSAALNHLMSLMDVESSAMYIAHVEEDIFKNQKHVMLACTGKFVNLSETLENSSVSDDVQKKIFNVFKSKESIINKDYYIGYFETAINTASVLYIEIINTSEYFQADLLQLYSANIALILENILAHREVEETQRDLMYIIGDAIEARSKETGAHVKRAAIICELLATKLHESDSFIKLIKFAAPLHDLGKIAIPETILHKPGKLDAEEWEIMKTHAAIGADILKKSNSTVALVGARIARYHHENWDGSGYPDSLAGKEIPLEARLMAVADVFDALGSKRSYKNEWGNEDIKEFLFSQKGIKFDPEIVDVMLDSYPEFIAIREQFPD